MNTRFLRQIADYYGSKAPSSLAGYTFVTPNKRSAMFLKRYIRDAIPPGSGAVILPRFITFSRMLTHFAEFGEGRRNELLFTLYEALRRVYAENGRGEHPGEFDSFIFWGDMMLNDFNEIDTSLADASAIFKNIRDIKEIQSDFLDEEQKEIVRRLWGESRLTRRAGDVRDGESEFWLHIGRQTAAEGGGESLSAGFKTLWDLQGRIYETFHKLLREKQCGTAGTTARSAWKKIKEMDRSELPYPTHYVFAGFGEPSTVETVVMKRLHALGLATFFWDVDETAALLGEKGPRNNSISRILSLAKELKAPDDFTPAPLRNDKPEIEVIASPSKIAQAKAVNQLLREWIKEGVIDSSDPVNTAIVLPDESLLMPVLFSIPEEIEAVNITMGVAYSTTTFAGLLKSIISMQRRAGRIHGEECFFHEDVTTILSHPHLRLIFGSKVDAILKAIRDGHIYNISPRTIAETDAELAETVFRPVKGSDAAGVAAYLTTLIDRLAAGLGAGEDKPDMLETKLLGHFRREVAEIMELVKETQVEMNGHSFFILLERMFSTAQIGVNGKPLQGLQIMGVLETRALDFDNVIILSMNEGTFPRKQYVKTMIPNVLRIGHGLPELNAREGVYAYCFFRLLGRARRVKLLYDSRTGVNGAGEESRYISQLRYLLPGLGLRHTTLELPASLTRGRVITVAKTPEVMGRLDRFRDGRGTRYLSASALKTFKRCPLQFYLANVNGLRSDDEMVNYMTAAEYGSIFHRVCESLFKPYEGREVDATVLRGWTSEAEATIRPLVDSAIFEIRHPKRFRDGHAAPPQTREEQTMADAVFSLIVKLLGEESEKFAGGGRSFRYIKGEQEVKGTWHVSPDTSINFKMYIDRVDSPSAGTLRFIDYKTGSDATEVCVERLCDPTYATNSDAVFQLLTYCEAYADMEHFDGAIQPLIYSIRNAYAGTALDPIKHGAPRSAKAPLLDYRDVSAIFRPQLEGLIADIFNPEKPFAQCEDPADCTYCPFTALCGRSPKKY